MSLLSGEYLMDSFRVLVFLTQFKYIDQLCFKSFFVKAAFKDPSDRYGNISGFFRYDHNYYVSLF
mgnify:CR=1 FL=1